MNSFNNTLIEGVLLRDPEEFLLSDGQKAVRFTIDSRRMNRKSAARDFWITQMSIVLTGQVDRTLLEHLKQKGLIRVYGALDQELPHKCFETPWTFVLAECLVLTPFSDKTQALTYELAEEVWHKASSE